MILDPNFGSKLPGALWRCLLNSLWFVASLRWAAEYLKTPTGVVWETDVALSGQLPGIFFSGSKLSGASMDIPRSEGLVSGWGGLARIARPLKPHLARDRRHPALANGPHSAKHYQFRLT